MLQMATLNRYSDAFISSQQFLATISIGMFPLDVFSLPTLIKEKYGFNIIISSLSNYNLFREAQGIMPYNLPDGECIYISETNEYNIIYNDKQNKKRIRFTIMHEIAHIILGHVGPGNATLSRISPTDSVKLRYEGEANTFAGNALAPPILIDELLDGQPFDTEKIMARFQLSRASVVNYRKQDYFAWHHRKKLEAEHQISMNSYLSSMVKHCDVCKTNFYDDKINKYCTICGNKGLSQGWTTHFKTYSSIEVNAKGQAYTCPYCKEDVRAIDYGKLFHSCGAHLINQCSRYRCGIPAEGNARYCYKCGAGTSFGYDRTLKSWEVSK